MYTTKNVVVNPFKLDDVEVLHLAENLPSAAALQLTEEISAKMHKSHIVIESPSMGLIMRFVFTDDFKTTINFCNQITVHENDKEHEFFFESINDLKAVDRDAVSSGLIRSTLYEPLAELEENTWSADEWHQKFLIVTNIGLFFFQPNRKEEPKFVSWKNFNAFELIKDQKD